MTCLLDYTPGPPDYVLPWAEMHAEYPWLRALSGCPQDPIHHAEGDVWIHTRMVCQELLALDAWRSLSEEQRRIVFAAAVLHDIGKPDCTKNEEGRITSRGHSRRGTILARNILWRMGVPFAAREMICALIRYHQVPYFLIDREDSTRLAIEVSCVGRGDLLTILANADVRGRICQDKQRLLDNVALCREQMRELGVVDRAYPFASDHARVLYFKNPNRQPDAPAYVEHRCEVILLSGLPGSGKDHHIRTHFPEQALISLDDLRAELDVLPGENQGEVLTAARDRARDYLREGTPFVWNATNLMRQLRTQPVELFLRYGARVRIVYVEVPAEVLFRQNRERSAVVPERVMERFLDRWEVPDVTEAHAVEYVVRTGAE
jgi:predicted kinase